MKKRALGNTGLNVSVLGFGCASYWGMPYYSEKEAGQLIHTALEHGINFFDTGHSYSHGNAEPRLGRILKEIPSNIRSNLVISTKAGTRNKNYSGTYKDFSPTWVKQSVEISLRQLGLEQIPLLHLHGPQVADFTDELIQLISSLKKQGKIHSFCVNSFDTEVLNYCLNSKDIDCVMIDYNFLKQDRKPLIKLLYEAKKGVIGGAALANHVFVNPFKKIRRPRDIWYLLRAFKNHREGVEKAKQFNWINSVAGLTANQIALAFALENPHISCSVFGTTRIKHLEENISAVGLQLSDEIKARLS